MRRALATLTVLICATALASCGGSESDGGLGPDPSTEPKVIDVTIEGDMVTPNGERVEVSVDQPIALHVTADAAGEIHVHSSPEQELEYDEGVTDLELDPITTPGTVDIESHTLDKVIVQLEVS